LVIKKIVLVRKRLSIDVIQSKSKFSKKTAIQNKPIKTLFYFEMFILLLFYYYFNKK